MNEKTDTDDTDLDEFTDTEAAPELDAAAAKPTRRQRARQRILRSTAVLPSLFTVCNGLAGFGAIHFATKDAAFEARLGNLGISAWLIVLAMIFDMLDGRVARMTRRTSDFGGQLDSLCDMVSFGVAPAIMMLRMVGGALREIEFLPHVVAIERTVWCMAAVYVACAALRLARFNVENEPDESAHMDFRGLPSPGAAAAVTGLVLLFERVLLGTGGGWLSSPWLNAGTGAASNPWLLGTISVLLAAVTLAAGLLMVSRFRYVHMVNHYIRGRRPFNYLVKVVLLALAVAIEPFVSIAAGTVIYAASGPAGALLRRLRPVRGEVDG